MILSELIISNKTNTYNYSQRIYLKCDQCEKEYESILRNQIFNHKNYNCDLCRSCKQKEQYKSGLRESKIGEYNKSNTGKTFIERFGQEKAKNISIKFSKNSSGENNPNFGNKTGFGTSHQTFFHKDKTWIEMYGEEKAKKLKEKLSIKNLGSNNPMFGKSSPIGSGNGWSGWYKGWYFRSLMELSFMINVIERFNFSWKNAESKEYRMFYEVDGKVHSYVADFILNDKFMIEVKPKKLQNSFINKLKKEAAIEFCKNTNLKYKMIEVDKLSFDKLLVLVNNEEVMFIDRYMNKFQQLHLSK